MFLYYVSTDGSLLGTTGLFMISLWIGSFSLAFIPSVPKSDRKDAEALFKPNKTVKTYFSIYYKV